MSPTRTPSRSSLAEPGGDLSSTKSVVSVANRLRHPLREASPPVGTVLIVVVLLCLLQLAGALDIGGPGVLPTTSEVVAALLAILSEGSTYLAVMDTMVPWVIGFVLASLGGVVVGILVGPSSFSFRSTRGLFDFLRATPPVAFIPLVVLMLGTGYSLKISLIVFAGIWIVLLQSTAGIRHLDKVAMESARSLRMRWWQRTRWVLVPSMLPFILTGMRVAALNAFLLCIGVELIAGSPGIGQEILLRQMWAAIPDMWAYVALSAVLGVAVSSALTKAESSLLKWHVSQRDISI